MSYADVYVFLFICVVLCTPDMPCLLVPGSSNCRCRVRSQLCSTRDARTWPIKRDRPRVDPSDCSLEQRWTSHTPKLVLVPVEYTWKVIPSILGFCFYADHLDVILIEHRYKRFPFGQFRPRDTGATRHVFPFWLHPTPSKSDGYGPGSDRLYVSKIRPSCYSSPFKSGTITSIGASFSISTRTSASAIATATASISTSTNGSKLVAIVALYVFISQKPCHAFRKHPTSSTGTHDTQHQLSEIETLTRIQPQVSVVLFHC
jgi:hypothetical protein